YEDTRGFSNALEEKAWDILALSGYKKVLCTEGKYDPEKVIDIEQFAKNGKVAKEPGELSFKLQDLIQVEENRETILVCQKPEGKLKYQYLTE
ncbi:hypothetical protein RFZ55_11175, partial [Acinetobacter baumannii]|nr:hypothetical protein [Acinetobacter baumannii]